MKIKIETIGACLDWRAFFLFLIGALGVAADATGQNRLFPFANRKREESNNTQLTQDSGPWLVMCGSFSGEYAESDAHALAEELRRAGFKCYVHRQELDIQTTYESLEISPYEEDARRDPVTGVLIPTDRKQTLKLANENRPIQWAVLVGDFPTLEDNRAQSALNAIKSYQPQAVRADAHELAADVKANNLARTRSDYSTMASAFLVVNPLLPEEYFTNAAIDTEMIEYNRKLDLKYGLMKNKAPYSVRVASFRGDTRVSTSGSLLPDHEETEKRRWGFGARKQEFENSKLAEATLKASVLTKVLREEGVEAWEFHDRFESYVCVGSFDWVSKKDSLGLDEINPAVLAVIEKYKGGYSQHAGFQGKLEAKSHKKLRGKGISFDVQPVPVAVPRIPNSRTARK